MATILEECEHYKKYREEQDEIMSKMTEKEQVEYLQKKQDEAIKKQKELGLSSISFDDILKGENANDD